MTRDEDAEAGATQDPLPGPGEAEAPDSRELNAVLVIFFVALLLRFANLQQIHANDPFFTLPAVDPAFYHEWAKRIASGDWLGEGVFLQGPLYPYLLGLHYSITGPNLFLPRVIQCLLGAVSCVLVWAVAREVFDRRVGLLAGAMSSVYGMSIFYGGSLLIVNLLTPLILCLLLLMIRAQRRPGFSGFAGVGIAIGLCTLARPNMLLYLPFALIWLPVAIGRAVDARRRVLLALTLFAGFALCVTPSLLRNRLVADDWVLVTASGGMNFYNGNNPDATGLHKVPPLFDRSLADHPAEQNRLYRATAEEDLGRSLAASEVSDYWFGKALDWVREDPAGWLGLLYKKFRIFIGAAEPWNVRSTEVSRQFSWVLRLPLLTFGWLAPFALLGLGLGLRRWRSIMPLYALVGLYAATCVVFFVLSRYRQPAVPVLIIFAAFAAVWFFDALRGARWREFAIAAACTLALVVITQQEFVGENLSVAYYNLGNKYRLLGRYEQSIEQYDRSLAIDSGYISAYNNRALSLELSSRPRAEVIDAWLGVRALGEERGLTKYVERADRHLQDLANASANGE